MIRARLIEIATKARPTKAPAAPAAATKKSDQPLLTNSIQSLCFEALGQAWTLRALAIAYPMNYWSVGYGPHQSTNSRSTAPISAWMTTSDLSSMSVGSRLMMASAAPFDFATIGSAAAG